MLDYIDVTQRLQKYLQNASDHRCIKVFRKSISSLDSCVNIKLTKQEDSLLPYIISGLNNKKIAQATDLSNMMISHYRRNIYQKLNVRNIAGLYHFLHSLRGISSLYGYHNNRANGLCSVNEYAWLLASWVTTEGIGYENEITLPGNGTRRLDLTLCRRGGRYAVFFRYNCQLNLQTGKRQ